MDKQRAQEVMARMTIDTEYPPGADESRHLDVRRLAGTLLLLFVQAEDAQDAGADPLLYWRGAADVLVQLGAAVCYPSAAFAEDITAARNAVAGVSCGSSVAYYCNADGGYTRLLLGYGANCGEGWSVRLLKTGVSPRPNLTAFVSDDS